MTRGLECVNYFLFSVVNETTSQGKILSWSIEPFVKIPETVRVSQFPFLRRKKF